MPMLALSRNVDSADIFISCQYATATSETGVPSLSLTMYPLSISTDERVPLKFLMTKKAE